MTWTVTQLARIAGLSRTALLYYESVGLLQPARSGSGNYRRYSQKDRQRLEQILFYKRAGLPLEDIKAILDGGPQATPDRGLTAILERRLGELNAEIEARREQQRIILGLLRKPSLVRRWKVITKDKWVSIMQAAGFSEAEMHRWHVEFERSAPAEHQEFLEFLHIPGDEIVRIREWSSRAGNQHSS
jgi:MerR family transcriptional regulator, thiopeptide resistance regulator